MAGRVCRHCKLEERFWQWEVGQGRLACLFLGICAQTWYKVLAVGGGGHALVGLAAQHCPNQLGT